MAKRTIVVVGATGSQGGGLARAILNDPDGEFALRAVTRNPDSDAARALADAGADVAKADLDDLESILRAFEGAYGAFCVTNYWEIFSPDRETQQASHMATAAKEAGLEHVVWSTLEDSRDWVPLDDDRLPTLMGRHKVPHFEGKAEADQYFEDLPTTFMMASFYWDNMISFGAGPRKMEDGSYALVMPMGDSKLAGIAAEDIGKCVYGLFQRPDEYIGRRVGLAGEHVRVAEMAAKMSRAIGIDIGYVDIPADAYRSFDFPGAADLGNMFQFYRDFADDTLEARSVEESRRLNPELQSFDDWLERNASRIPLD
jgi:uncharacterized protein YbjT (DUF2867 family)